MAGTSRQGGLGEARGDGSAAENQGDEYEEEEILFVPPRLNGLHLTVTWPIKCPVTCMVGNCRTKFKSGNRYSVVNDLVGHIKDIHKMIVSGKTNMCAICHIAIGRCPANHACFKTREMLVQTDEGCNYKCDKCPSTFPSWRGLSNHKQTHKKDEIQNKYNIKKGLPITAKAGGTSGVGNLKKTVTRGGGAKNVPSNNLSTSSWSLKNQSLFSSRSSPATAGATGKSNVSGAKKTGADIDNFIRDTKKFIGRKNGLDAPTLNNDGSLKSSHADSQIETSDGNSIIITDDDINKFVEVVTGSGIDHPLSSTLIHHSSGNDLSSQHLNQSSVQGRTIDGQVATA